MKFFQKRAVALTVMILTIVAAIAWGQYKKPAALPKVKEGEWISDGAGVLSARTEELIRSRNAEWNDRYYAVCAVATVDSAKGWKIHDYTVALGEAWGLEYNDLLLVIDVAAANGDRALWGLEGGENIMDAMTELDRSAIRTALSSALSQGRWDDAVGELFDVLDGVYAARLGTAAPMGSGNAGGAGGWSRNGMGRLVLKFLLVLAVVFILWVILDRRRYDRYQRRSTTPGSSAPRVDYYPVFWGHSSNPPRPVHRPSGGSSYRPPSGGIHPAPGSHARPSGGFGSSGGMSGGRRGGGGVTRSGGSITRSGGGTPRGGGFGSRGGMSGGRR